MELIRVFIKFAGFILATLFFYSLIMLCLILSVFGVNYEKFRGYLLRTWGKSCCRIFGIELKVKNPAPEPPFLLVSNHLSYIDVFVLFSQLRCLFVAKSDVKSWPLFGFIIRTSGILFIDRERKRDVTRVNKLISKNTNSNQGIILFPEGTTSPGFDVLPFRSSLLEYPASQNMPVSYAAISYETGEGEVSAYQSICWWDETPFSTHFLNFLKLKKCTATINFGTQTILDSDRKSLAIKLNKALESEFDEVISEEHFLNKHSEFVSVLS